MHELVGTALVNYFSIITSSVPNGEDMVVDFFPHTL